MLLCWHFKKFNWRRFRARVPAKLIDEWCHFLRRRPQGQYHQDNMAAGIASAICARNGFDIPPERFMLYEQVEKPREQEHLCQAQIDANVQWALAHQPKREVKQKGT